MGKGIDIRRFGSGVADDGEIESPLDPDIREALQVNVRKSLPGRILLRQSLVEERGKGRRWKNACIVTASVLLAIAVLVTAMPDTQNIGRMMLTHVHNERNHLNKKHNVSDARLNSLLASLGGRLTGSIGQVNYAGLCDIRKGESAHIVIDSQHGPVTVFLMPGENIDSRTNISDDQFTGVIFPVAWGGMAIVAENPAALPGIEAKIVQAIHWPS